MPASGVDDGGVDPELDRAIRPVLHDAGVAGVPVPVVADDEWIESEGIASARLPGIGIRAYLGAPAGC